MRIFTIARNGIAALMILALVLPGVQASAQADWVDGTYTADYLVLKAEDDSVSMANDYWEKPATVVFDKGKTTIRLTINHSDWVTQFKVPGNGGYVDTKIVLTNKADNKRIVEFAAVDVTSPIISKIHVTVKEIDYDHDYTIRLVFKADSFKLIKAAEVPVDEPEVSPSNTGSAEKSAVQAEAAGSKETAANEKAENLVAEAVVEPTPDRKEPEKADNSATTQPPAAVQESKTADAKETAAIVDLDKKATEQLAEENQVAAKTSTFAENSGSTEEPGGDDDKGLADEQADADNEAPQGEAGLEAEEEETAEDVVEDSEPLQEAGTELTNVNEASTSFLWWLSSAVLLVAGCGAFYLMRSRKRNSHQA